MVPLGEAVGFGIFSGVSIKGGFLRKDIVSWDITESMLDAKDDDTGVGEAERKEVTNIPSAPVLQLLQTKKSN